MAVTYGFYNSHNGDRVYDADQFSSVFDGLITDGIYRAYGSAFMVTPGTTPMTVIVGVGRAWIKHTWTLNNSNLVLTISPSSQLYDRIDRVVIRVDKANRVNSIVVITGTAAANPFPPAMAATDTLIANIRVKTGASSITDADIDYVVGTPESPYITGIVTDITDYRISQLLAYLREQRDNANALLTTWLAEKTSDFESWWQEIQDIISGDTAANLAQLVAELRSDVDAIEPKIKLLTDPGARRLIPEYTGVHTYNADRAEYDLEDIDPAWIRDGTMGPLRIGDIIKVRDTGSSSRLLELVIVDFNYWCSEKAAVYGMTSEGNTQLTPAAVTAGQAEGKNHIVVAFSSCWGLVNASLADKQLGVTQGTSGADTAGVAFYETALYNTMQQVILTTGSGSHSSLRSLLTTNGLDIFPHIEYYNKRRRSNGQLITTTTQKNEMVTPLSMTMAFGHASTLALDNAWGTSSERQLRYFANYPDPFGRFYHAYRQDGGSIGNMPVFTANGDTRYWLKDGAEDDAVTRWYVVGSATGSRVLKQSTGIGTASVIPVMAISAIS